MLEHNSTTWVTITDILSNNNWYFLFQLYIGKMNSCEKMRSGKCWLLVLELGNSNYNVLTSITQLCKPPGRPKSLGAVYIATLSEYYLPMCKWKEILFKPTCYYFTSCFCLDENTVHYICSIHTFCSMFQSAI